MTNIFWFTKDLRLQDNGALNAAVLAAEGHKVAPVYVVDLADYRALAGIRQHSLTESLRALNGTLGGKLNVIQATTAHDFGLALANAAKGLGAATVYATRLYDPAGKALQFAVGHFLADRGVHLILEDSQYAVPPGVVKKADGTPYKVYTPYQRLWQEHGWDKPKALPLVDIEWLGLSGVAGIAGQLGLPQPDKSSPFVVKAGELFALQTWARFKERALYNYDEVRNRADLSGTSHLSHALAFGEIHPRTLLAQLADVPGHNVYRKELAWREFYADVLWHNPHTTTEYYAPRFAGMRYDTGALAESRLAAWQQGKTGYPMVDAGMRQLLETGWIHNRVRMIVASFLVKDLHLEWQQGAAWFEQNLSDFDPASNAHGWQWTAGCGTDASPYYRIFNPVGQGLKFDPNGDYVRKFVPELRHLAGADVHEPWAVIGGYSGGYPQPIVDHATEREESLRRLEEIKR